MEYITVLSSMMIVTALLDFLPIYSNWGYFWAMEIIIQIDRAKNLLHCKIRDEPLNINSKYGQEVNFELNSMLTLMYYVQSFHGVPFMFRWALLPWMDICIGSYMIFKSVSGDFNEILYKGAGGEV